jgi:hypothetical protein
MSRNNYVCVSQEAVTLLHDLSLPGAELFGRFDRDEPFVRLDRANPDPEWRALVAPSVARELHDAGFIEVNEFQPIAADLFPFQISLEGRAWLYSVRSLLAARQVRFATHRSSPKITTGSSASKA